MGRDALSGVADASVLSDPGLRHHLFVTLSQGLQQGFMGSAGTTSPGWARGTRTWTPSGALCTCGTASTTRWCRSTTAHGCPGISSTRGRDTWGRCVIGKLAVARPTMRAFGLEQSVDGMVLTMRAIAAPRLPPAARLVLVPEDEGAFSRRAGRLGALVGPAGRARPPPRRGSAGGLRAISRKALGQRRRRCSGIDGGVDNCTVFELR